MSILPNIFGRELVGHTGDSTLIVMLGRNVEILVLVFTLPCLKCMVLYFVPCKVEVNLIRTQATWEGKCGLVYTVCTYVTLFRILLGKTS